MPVNKTTGEVFELPDHEAVVVRVAEVIHDWFPDKPKDQCTNLAFHLVHQVLSVRPVDESGLYSMFLRPATALLE